MGTTVSEREREVLGAVAEHLTNAEIAGRLHISVRTVESHVASLLRKLGATERRQLVARASEVLSDEAVSPAGITGLPNTLTSFIGREIELDGLVLALDESRLITLVGPGGVGKTRLAIAAAQRLEDGSWLDGGFVNLVPVGADFVMQAVAAVFGVGERPEENLEQVLLRRLGSRRHLLILDNCEHVLPAAAALVRSILESCPQTAVLATSRQRLDVEGERVFAVAPLSVSLSAGETEVSDAKVSDAKVSDAERLFVARSGAPFDGAHDLARVSQICRRLDGMPLAIELAAARFGSLGLDGLLAGLDDDLRLLSRVNQLRRVSQSGNRHSSLRSVIDWSHALLDPDEKVLFRRLGVFRGGFDLASAHLVAGSGTLAETSDLLGRLVDKSLLVRTDVAGRSRWRMLDTIRAYARERLSSSGEEHDAGEKHLEWACGEARALVALLGVAGEWRARFDSVVDDLRSDVATGAGGRTAFELALALGHLTFARRYLAESRGHLQAAVNRAPDDASAVTALRLAAGALFSEMRGEASYQMLLEASRRAARSDDRRTGAIVLADAATLAGRAPALFTQPFELPAVVDLVRQAAELAPPDDLEVETYLAVARAWCTANGFASSQAGPANEALALARRLDQPRLLSIALDAAAAACTAEHRFRDSARLTAERVALLDRLARHDPDVGGEVADIYHMANEAAIAVGRLDDALAIARRQEVDEATYGLDHFAAKNLVTVLALKGDFEAAVEQANVMLTGWEQAGRPAAAWMGPPFCAAAMVHGLRGDLENYAVWTKHARAVSAGRPSASGFARYAGIRVALHAGDLPGAGRVAAIETDDSYAPFAPYTLVVGAEVAVLTGAPDREERLAAAERFAAENDFVAAQTTRIDGLLRADREALLRSVRMWEAIGARFERACTLLHLPDRLDEARRELASLGCLPPTGR